LSWVVPVATPEIVMASVTPSRTATVTPPDVAVVVEFTSALMTALVASVPVARLRT
jgi:hypothetical protein